jgi:hypothetical protein
VSGLRSAQVIDVTPERVDLTVGSEGRETQKAAALPAAAIEIETDSTEESER